MLVRVQRSARVVPWLLRRRGCLLQAGLAGLARGVRQWPSRMPKQPLLHGASVMLHHLVFTRFNTEALGVSESDRVGGHVVHMLGAPGFEWECVTPDTAYGLLVRDRLETSRKTCVGCDRRWCWCLATWRLTFPGRLPTAVTCLVFYRRFWRIGAPRTVPLLASSVSVFRFPFAEEGFER